MLQQLTPTATSAAGSQELEHRLFLAVQPVRSLVRLRAWGQAVLDLAADSTLLCGFAGDNRLGLACARGLAVALVKR